MLAKIRLRNECYPFEGNCPRRLCLAVLLPLAVGCFQPETITPEQLDRGYILLLPGVENTKISAAGICRGLRDAGDDRAIDFDQWGYRPFGSLRNLTAYELNRQRAARLARKVADYRAGHPDQPITVIGFSGGGAIALFTAEALPKEVVVDQVVLLGAAISPGYDVGPTLAHCRRGLINGYSAGDWLLGGWATETFGTMDRKRTSTAGRLGFQSAAGQLLVREGLKQVAWTPRWRKLGHDGGHPGWLARVWVREVLAKLIKADASEPPTRPS
jgi:pimeloyl-ACP methyl ester carboxylesterase